jgi:hypothetical protein
MLSPGEVEFLLKDLCVQLGFCLPPDDQVRLCEHPPSDVESFTNEVFLAEGLDPQFESRQLKRSVSEVIRKAMDRAASS